MNDTDMLPGSYPHRKYIVCMVWNIIKWRWEEVLPMRDNEQTTNSEDRATQPMEAGGWVSQNPEISVYKKPPSLPGPKKATLQLILAHLGKVLFYKFPTTWSHQGGRVWGAEQDGREQPWNCVWPDNGIVLLAETFHSTWVFSAVWAAGP